jgi:hypothetical protein
MLAPRGKTGARFDLATLSGPSDFTRIVRVLTAFVGIGLTLRRASARYTRDNGFKRTQKEKTYGSGEDFLVRAVFQ